MILHRAIVLTLVGCYLCLPSILVADGLFSVVIVPDRQREAKHTDKLDSGETSISIIPVPIDPVLPNGVGSDVPSGHHFYVVIRNDSKDWVVVNYATENWYNCLHFQITASSGKTFSIRRPGFQVWYANALEPWTFEPGGMRVVAIDFTTGRWVGFPSATEMPRRETFKIKAVFKCHDKDRKKEVE